ncbi:peptidoglycan-binding domain-containing protein [Streptomyces sp. NPDC051135]|uniref:peptidoglycan-binding domain-containing protein n=1 Tax=unclassified Streptomyces TaxID=2593676 RepID=UPI0034395BFF
MEQQKEPSQEPPARGSCPECGTPREADNTPSCACGARASDALRDARTAQAAAAEDFDPLRIRPYVELDGSREPAGPGAAGHPESGPPGGHPAAPPADEPPPAAAQEAGRATADAGSGAGAGAPVSDRDATVTLRAVDAGADGARTAAGPADGDAKPKAVLPTPLAPSAGSPSAHDLRLFETSGTAPLPRTLPDGSGAPGTPGTDGAPGTDGDGRPPRRRRTGLLLSAAGAVVVVVGAAGFASGLFSYDTPSRDGALPTDVRAGVPDPSTGEASPGTAAPSTASSPSARSVPPSPSASASPSQSASASASPSPSASSASTAPSRSAEPTGATTAPADDAPQEPEDDDPDLAAGPTLRRGDQGPEVVELQQRLAGMKMYRGDANGDFDRQVEDAVRQYQWFRGIYTDGVGVYGPDTRRRLESEPQKS